MATITTRAIIDGIIAAGGRQYEDEPPVIRIVEYTSQSGETVYGVVWEGDRDPHRYDRETAYIHNPRVIFSAEWFDQE